MRMPFFAWSALPTATSPAAYTKARFATICATAQRDTMRVIFNNWIHCYYIALATSTKAQ